MFYKKLDDNSITYGPYVQSSDYLLTIDSRDLYEYPLDGWYWFDAEIDALTFWGVDNFDPPISN